MAKTEKAPLPPPPPDPQAAYDALLAQNADLSASLTAAKAQIADLERAAKAQPETAGLQLQVERLKAELDKHKLQAERATHAAARAQQELKAHQGAAPPKGGRNFLYVKGDPKDPKSPRERVQAHTQLQADAQAAHLLEQGYKFRGIVG